MEKPTFKEAFLFWLKLGFISFGGPAGQIAIMNDFLVDKKKWISQSRFLHALNYCMLLPGPEAQQLAIYIGWLLHGIKGGLTAGILFILPSIFILGGLSITYVTFGTLPWVAALFYGLKPAVVAVVLLALVKISGKFLKGAFQVTIALLSFILIFFLYVPFPAIIISVIIIGLIANHFFPQLFISGKEGTKEVTNEEEYYINANSISENKTSKFTIIKQVIVSVILWSIPLILFYFLTSDFNFWKSITLFFTKSAFVTFGGAYAVLPYVAQVTVKKFHWLSAQEMIDGLALGETTPGPLIMVLAFVGFMGGYNHYHGSVFFGCLGLLTTVFYTFLPCFLLIFAGAPLIEMTNSSSRIKNVLNVVSAAVVGVVLNLAIYFAQAVVFPQGLNFNTIDLFSLAWIIISFIAMHRFKIGMITWIAISAAAGLIKYLISINFF